MITDFKMEHLASKAEGKFKLTVLVQKRLGELMRNGEPIGSVGNSRAFARVLKEIETGGIALLPEGSRPEALLG